MWYGSEEIESERLVKPLLSVSAQIDHLKSKGVRFKAMDESEAERYLTYNNSYFRLRSYRTAFDKYEAGSKEGKYISLDFGMLVDLAVIDMLLRKTFLPLTIDVEHYYKLRLLRRIEREGEDGYTLVHDYLEHESARMKDAPLCLSDLVCAKGSTFTQGLLDKYNYKPIPVWAYVELIAFGDFVYFLKYCAERFGDKELNREFYLLQPVRILRNASAHNSCILNDLKSCSDYPYKPSYEVMRALSKLGISKKTRASRMSNERLRCLAYTLYLHQCVASAGVRDHVAIELSVFSKRMMKNIDWYKEGHVRESFAFIQKLIKGWYPLG